MAREGEFISASKFAFFSGVVTLLTFIAYNGLILVTALLALNLTKKFDT